MLSLEPRMPWHIWAIVDGKPQSCPIRTAAKTGAAISTSFSMVFDDFPGLSLVDFGSFRLDFRLGEPRFTRTFSSWSDEVFSSCDKAHRRMATAGGGACKFAPLFRDALRATRQRRKTRYEGKTMEI